jgi:hypothetical protein
MEENIKQLEIVEKYEEFVNYIYPICVNIPKGGHVTLRMRVQILKGIPRDYNGHTMY